MLRHIVFFRFNPKTDESDIEDLAQSLGRLPEFIEEIHEFTFGRDIVRSERSFDFALVSTFENMEAMQRYQIHPEHQKVTEKVRRLCSEVAAVDFEF